MARAIAVKLDLEAAEYIAEAKAVEARTEAVHDDMKALGRQVDEVGRDMDKLAAETALAKHQVGDLGVQARKASDDLKITTGNTAEFEQRAKAAAAALLALDSRIATVKASVKDLGAQFAITGDKGIGKDLNSQRSLLGQLTRVRKELTAVSDDGVKAGLSLGENLSKGLESGLDSLGPGKGILYGTLISAAVAASPLIASIIGGAVTGGVGTVAIAAGLFSASRDPRVLAAANEFGSVLSDEFFGNSQAFVQPAVNALHILESAAINLHLGDSLAKAAPTVTKIAQGLADFATNVMPGVNKTLDRLGPFADAAAEGFANLGTSVGDFLDMVSESPGALEGLITGFKLLDGAVAIAGANIRALENVYDAYVKSQIAIDDSLENGFRSLHQDAIADFVGKVSAGFHDIADGAPIAASSAGAVAAVMGQYTDKAKEAADATHDFIDAWNQLNHVQLDLDSAMLAATQAVNDVKDTFNDGTKSVIGHSQAVLENRVALEQAAQAAQEAAQAYLNSGGSAAGAQQILDEYRDSAEKATGATGRARDSVDDLATSLFKLPSVTNIGVNVTTRYTTVGNASQINKNLAQADRLEGRASGGDVMAGVPYKINERGFETVTFPANGMVHPASLTPIAGTQWQAAAPAGGGGRATNNYYSVTVNAAPLTSPIEVGAAVISAVKQYEGANGTGWRS